MTNLEMTRPQCANLIERFASDLRYYTERVSVMAAEEQQDSQFVMTVELQLRQTIKLLV